MGNEALDAAVTEFVAAVEDRNRINRVLKAERANVPKPAKNDPDAIKKYVAAYVKSYGEVRPQLDAIYDRIGSSGATVISLTDDTNIVNPVQALVDAAAAERAESDKLMARIGSLAKAGTGKWLLLLSVVPVLFTALPRQPQIKKNLTDLTSYYLLEMMDDDR